MKIYNSLKNDQHIITGYGEFIFATIHDAEMAIKLAEAHAENVLKSYHDKTSKLLYEATNKFE